MPDGPPKEGGKRTRPRSVPLPANPGTTPLDTTPAGLPPIVPPPPSRNTGFVRAIERLWRLRNYDPAEWGRLGRDFEAAVHDRPPRASTAPRTVAVPADELRAAERERATRAERLLRARLQEQGRTRPEQVDIDFVAEMLQRGM